MVVWALFLLREGDLISEKRLYLTADGEVVEEGDERAATLLVGEGCELDNVTAFKYGLLESLEPERVSADGLPARLDLSNTDIYEAMPLLLERAGIPADKREELAQKLFAPVVQHVQGLEAELAETKRLLEQARNTKPDANKAQGDEKALDAPPANKAIQSPPETK